MSNRRGIDNGEMESGEAAQADEADRSDVSRLDYTVFRNIFHVRVYR